MYVFNDNRTLLQRIGLPPRINKVSNHFWEHSLPLAHILRVPQSFSDFSVCLFVCGNCYLKKLIAGQYRIYMLS